MAFDSEGNFTRLHSWEQDRINDIEIASDRHDEEDDNFASGLNECFLKDGRAPLQGNLKMGGYQIKNLANATVATDAVTKSQLDGMQNNISSSIETLLNKLWKIGDVKASVLSSNHDHWFLCNGQALSRTEYADLFEIIGTNFGSGDGVSTFNLPDYRGKFLRGLGGNSAADIYTTQTEGLPNITGEVGPFRFGANPKATGVFTTTTGSGIGDNERGGGYVNFDASLSSSIYGASDHVTPINQAINWFIKVKEEALS